MGPLGPFLFFSATFSLCYQTFRKHVFFSFFLSIFIFRYSVSDSLAALVNYFLLSASTSANIIYNFYYLVCILHYMYMNFSPRALQLAWMVHQLHLASTGNIKHLLLSLSRVFWCILPAKKILWWIWLAKLFLAHSNKPVVISHFSTYNVLYWTLKTQMVWYCNF